jgi:hypothetical protein
MYGNMQIVNSPGITWDKKRNLLKFEVSVPADSGEGADFAIATAIIEALKQQPSGVGRLVCEVSRLTLEERNKSGWAAFQELKRELKLYNATTHEWDTDNWHKSRARKRKATVAMPYRD